MPVEGRRTVYEDLSGLLQGEVRVDPLASTMYASDASLYQIEPLAVVFPRDRDDVVALARYAKESGIAVVPRGAGTGIAGEAIGRGIVVDFSRHTRQVEWIEDSLVRVQPGLVRDQLNELLRSRGRYFAPDPSNTQVTTVGGMLGVDAAGSRAIRVGSTRDHVESIELVLPGGTVLEVGREPVYRTPGSGDGNEGEAEDFKRHLVARLVRLLEENRELIDRHQPPLLRNTCGYNLRGVLANGYVDLPRLLVGSEGTLGLFTAATLNTLPLPRHRGAVLLLFGELESATRAVQLIARLQPAACDLLDRRLLGLAREANERFEQLISPAAEAALLVEMNGMTAQQVRQRTRTVVETARKMGNRARVAAEAHEPQDVEFLWSLPSTIVPLLTRLKGTHRPVPFVEDVAIPPAALHEFLVHAQRVFQAHQITATLYAHAATGQLHLRPFLEAPGPQDGRRLEGIARDLYQEVFKVGGTISGEHGDGLSRTSFVAQQYGPLYDVFREVKAIFDPHNVMNPGKIVSDDPHLTGRNLRPLHAESPDVVDLQLRWTSGRLADETGRCNGCGVCRSQSAIYRMCPFFRDAPSEETSPRSKANVMRALVDGEFDPRALATPEGKRLADTCFNCKQCELECPSNVNVPHMMVEARAAWVEANGLPWREWFLSRPHVLGAAASMMALPVNRALRNPAARWWMERLFGIARQRKLPRVTMRPFVRTAPRRLTRPPVRGQRPKPVVYFVDWYANYHDTDLARAFLAVLKHNGIPVHVPRGQTAAGMPMFSAGDLAGARELADQNVHALEDLARDGHDIVCTEPAAALCLSREYPAFYDSPDVELVAGQVNEAGGFLARLHAEGRLRTDFRRLDLNGVYHTPCHVKALCGKSPFVDLLSLIPGLRLRTIERGCSGMAGTFGLSAGNLRTSLRMGWGLLSEMRSGAAEAGVTECSSCKLQMEQGNSVPTVHPIKLLALAYGLMPELEAALRPSRNRLLAT